MRYQLAQVNIGRPLAPLDSEKLAGFVAALEPVNALADAAPGFVWRLTSDTADDATALRLFGSDGLADVMVNMSVWEDLDSLAAFVFRSGHIDVMRQRRSWFEAMTEAFAALWWVPQGALPTLDDAEARLRRLRELGPTPFAFTFRQSFPPPVPVAADGAAVDLADLKAAAIGVQRRADDDWSCPV
ncbi:MAG: hypothetical protein QOJ62_549 [Actinomycetota bacterium]|jgi:hypothetical protein|nr:hypothetical protein [Actinomycetota bacterium]